MSTADDVFTFLLALYFTAIAVAFWVTRSKKKQ